MPIHFDLASTKRIAATTRPGTARLIAAALIVIGVGFRSSEALSQASYVQPPKSKNGGGLFGPVVSWPFIPIHLSLLPDGRVLSFGINVNGILGGGGQLVYDIWDPKLGVGPGSHNTLKNTTKTDIFCNSGTWIGEGLNGTANALTRKFLSLGGELVIDGVPNYAQNDIVVFDPAADSLASAGKMQFPRWYASMTTLPNGDKLLLGGMVDRVTQAGVPTPEIFSPTRGWQTLSDISITEAVTSTEWYYPRAVVGSDGYTYLLQHNGKIFKLDLNGKGTMTDTGVRLGWGTFAYPSIMLPVKPNYPGFRMLLVRNNKAVQIVDLLGSKPVVKNAASLAYNRLWGNLTLLPDGNVLASGGSGVWNQLTDVAKQTELYHPASDFWSTGPTAAVARLYHSSTLLLPDGSVLTAGGGAPGPLSNTNAEILYPYYLYNPDGTPAPRPTIASAPSTLKLGQSFDLTVGANDTVRTVTLVRTGTQTHSYDAETRLIYVDFVQKGMKITGYMKSDPKIVPPGYYLLFVFDQQGHPSIAKIVSVPQAVL